jgi:hypothetical protein
MLAAQSQRVRPVEQAARVLTSIRSSVSVMMCAIFGAGRLSQFEPR